MNEINFSYIKIKDKKNIIEYFRTKTNFITQNPKTEVFFLFEIINGKNILLKTFTYNDIIEQF